MTANIAQSTWRMLGLSVAAVYTALGTFEIIFPRRAAKEFFALPEPSAKGTKAEDTAVSGAVALMMPLLGARDLTLAAALCTFASLGKWRDYGIVVMAGTILCAADCAVIWRRRGPGM